MSWRRLRPLLAICTFQLILFLVGSLVTTRSRCSSSSSPSLSPRHIYMITATHRRTAQIADLTRLSQTLKHVAHLHWVLVEDGDTLSSRVSELLARSNLDFVYLNAPRPSADEPKPPFVVGKGAYCRRLGLQWVIDHGEPDSVVYFGDDDNTYDIRLFNEMKETEGASVFPVGLILQLGVSAPIVVDSQVVAFHDAFQAGRKFALDMAGFAVHLSLLRAKNVTMSLRMSYMEDDLLTDLGLELHDLKPLANNCTEVLVWHTRTEGGNRWPSLDNLAKESERVDVERSSLIALYENFGLKRSQPAH